jgi:hypothetical protein
MPVVPLPFGKSVLNRPEKTIEKHSKTSQSTLPLVTAYVAQGQLNRDLLAVCQRVNESQPRLPDGKLLILHAPSSPCS